MTPGTATVLTIAFAAIFLYFILEIWAWDKKKFSDRDHDEQDPENIF